MTTLTLSLGALSVFALLGLATLLLPYPLPQPRLGPRRPPAWAALPAMKLPWLSRNQSFTLSWHKRLLIGAGSAWPLAAVAAHTGNPWLVLPTLGVFMAAPEAYLALLAARHTARKEAQVSRLVEGLCQALRDGNNLYQSLARAAQEVGPPLGEDLQKALDRFAVGGDMALALGELRQEATGRRLGELLDTLLFDLEEGVAGTAGEKERLESFLESLSQEEAARRELATKTAGVRFNLRLVSLTIPGTVLLVAATDSSLLTPLVNHPLGNLSLAVAVVAYLGTLWLSYKWSGVEL